MAKNKIEISREYLLNVNEETELINDISKQEFLDWMEINGFSEKQLKYFFQEKRISSTEQNRFNTIIRKAHDEKNISIIEIILYLENNFNRIKKILYALDEETKYLLKQELAIKYKIKVDKNILYKILG